MLTRSLGTIQKSLTGHGALKKTFKPRNGYVSSNSLIAQARKTQRLVAQKCVASSALQCLKPLTLIAKRSYHQSLLSKASYSSTQDAVEGEKETANFDQESLTSQLKQLVAAEEFSVADQLLKGSKSYIQDYSLPLALEALKVFEAQNDTAAARDCRIRIFNEQKGDTSMAIVASLVNGHVLIGLAEKALVDILNVKTAHYLEQHQKSPAPKYADTFSIISSTDTEDAVKLLELYLLCFRFIGDLEVSAGIANELVKMRPNNSAYQAALLSILSSKMLQPPQHYSQETAEAYLEAASQAEKRLPGATKATQHKFTALLALGRANEILQEHDKIIEEWSPEGARLFAPWYVSALCATSVQDLEEARSLIESSNLEAQFDDPNQSIFGKLQVVQLFSLLKEEDKVRTFMLEKVLKKDSDGLELHLNEVEEILTFTTSALQGADYRFEILETLYRYADVHAALTSTLAWEFYGVSEYEKALAYYKRLELITPLAPGEIFYKGHCMESLGRYEDALEQYNLNSEQEMSRSSIRYAIALLKMKRYPEALRRYEAQMQLRQPNSGTIPALNEGLEMDLEWGAFFLANTESLSTPPEYIDYEKALAHFMTAKDAWKALVGEESADVLRGIADSLNKLGREEEAKQWYERAQQAS